MQTMIDESGVALELSKAEALVLFHFLWRYTKVDRLVIEDQAEQRVLWDLLATLERTLVEPFDRNFPELLQKARDEIRDSTQ